MKFIKTTVDVIKFSLTIFKKKNFILKLKIKNNRVKIISFTWNFYEKSDYNFNQNNTKNKNYNKENKTFLQEYS